MKIEQFDVVWNGGVRSTVNASVGFHILSTEEDGKVDLKMMRRVLNLCQNHEDLHAKVVENTKHQLFDVIAQIEPLGYSSLSFDDENETKSRKETTLQDLEKMFSAHVDSILKKYGIVVDNVTITKIELAQDFIARSEEVQKVNLKHVFSHMMCSRTPLTYFCLRRPEWMLARKCLWQSKNCREIVCVPGCILEPTFMSLY